MRWADKYEASNDFIFYLSWYFVRLVFWYLRSVFKIALFAFCQDVINHCSVDPKYPGCISNVVAIIVFRYSITVCLAASGLIF